MFDEVDKWRSKVATVIVTREDQVAEMEIARTMRLALKKIRVNADHKRKELKAETDRYGKACQAAYNLLEFQISPLEKHLQDQEDFVERLKEKRIAETKEKRLAELAPFAIDTSFIDLGNMPEVSYMQFLATTRMAHEAKLAAAKKKAEDDLKELERQKAVEAENAKLKAEAEVAENKRKQALAEVARIAKENEDKLAKEKADHEAELARIKRQADDAAAAERGRLVMEQEAERKRLKAAADAEKAKLEAQAKLAQEQADLERDKRLASEQEARDKKAQEDAKAAQEAEAKRKAESAPDKEKMLAYADCLDHIYAPSVITETGKQLAASTLKALHDFTTKIRERANKFL
jgi:hypothetical protein